MESISRQQRSELLWTGDPQEVRKVEMRDRYSVDSGLLNAWRSGDQGVVREATSAHTESLKKHEADGYPFRRVRVVSEPLSEYQRMAVDIASVHERLRWLPRRLTSALLLPGNDFFVLDECAIFNVLDGDDEYVDAQVTRDPEVVAALSDAFERAWELAVPNGEYRGVRRPPGHEERF
ncbi:hypothetical protein J4573_38110 [Actinomadura barringtoniae]|uniref:DUF6879 domain-containing protein n=1 Tax=Actinomadura barringtoniae TaxID=1427535 RepID=A0A939PMU4_9ACTN|nr:DUF6879 family protein [Actinomadura barringtoniae]MBO2452958.1 hypothetical protein [Actinomadura barringtoniae]